MLLVIFLISFLVTTYLLSCFDENKEKPGREPSKERKMKIKPCPFCKGDDVRAASNTVNDRPAWVECSFCFAEGPVVDSKQEAIKAWNMRPHKKLDPKPVTE